MLKNVQFHFDFIPFPLHEQCYSMGSGRKTCLNITSKYIFIFQFDITIEFCVQFDADFNILR